MADPTKDPILVKLGGMQRDSENLRTQYDARWQRNIKLIKGLPVDDRKAYSEIRGKSKMYFRKIWATQWRLLASFYSAYLRDGQEFIVNGRDTISDAAKAKLLQFMMKYRIDKMNNDDHLFIKHIWSLQKILSYGIGGGKLSWEYNPELGKDGPVYTSYPNEQLFLDLTATTPSRMRYVIFENYMSRDELEENRYDNIEEAQVESIPSNQVRAARFQGTQDPLQNPGANEYPKPGTYGEERSDTIPGIYRVWECFWMEKGKIKFSVTNRDNCFLKEPTENPYGKRYPLVLGMCLVEPDKLIGEGFPEPMEGPQESYNYNLNMRKDNIALQLNPPTVISRYGGVDENALVNRTPRSLVKADDVNAVSFPNIPDATRTAYQEANADDLMMQELGGVMAANQGMETSDVATTAQINLSQGNAKIELYLAIGGETYFRSFYNLLAYYEQRFETDRTIFNVAEEQMIVAGYQAGFHNRIDDFDADVTISAGMAYAGREQQIRQALLILDRGAVYNQTQLALLQSGAVPAEGVLMFNGNQVFRDVLETLGKRELNKYFVNIPPPPMMPGAGAGGNGSVQGITAPQVGDMNGNMAPQNEFQAGSMGGF